MTRKVDFAAAVADAAEAEQTRTADDTTRPAAQGGDGGGPTGSGEPDHHPEEQAGEETGEEDDQQGDAEPVPEWDSGRPHRANPAGANPARPPSGGAKPNRDQPQRYPKRISLPLSADDNKALRAAKVDDDIDTVARLRAMVAIWRQDQKTRAKIDRLARKLTN